MRIKRLRLQNIRSYADQTVAFPDGTILVHGPNGAGKTSLLMGIFGGLFLSEIRNVGNNSFTLDEFVRRGETKGVVGLTFEVDNIEYTVEWELYTTGTPNAATLESPELPSSILAATPRPRLPRPRHLPQTARTLRPLAQDADHYRRPPGVGGHSGVVLYLMEPAVDRHSFCRNSIISPFGSYSISAASLRISPFASFPSKFFRTHS